MLSVFDLLAAETLELDLAAYLMARISRGASFMVGANPGGAGKTTVMCALLNFVPAGTVLEAATHDAVRRAARGASRHDRCLICHEIGAGPYFAYRWGEELRNYCALSEGGCMLATNLHADDVDEARMQVCVENGVPPSHFEAFRLLVFLRLHGTWQATHRRVERVYVSNGNAHKRVYEYGHGIEPDDAELDAAHFHECLNFLKRHNDGSLKTVENTRRLVLDFLEGNSG